MKLDWKQIVRPAAVLTIICVVVTAVLGGANALTKDAIAAQEAVAEQAARAEVLPGASEFRASGTENVWIGAANGADVGCVCITQTNGYGGALRVMTGISADGAVTGVSILKNSETVGLGANCVKESFRSQFVGTVPEKGYSVYKAGGDVPASGGIAALTGATITSNAVVAAVNEALQLYRTLNLKGGAQS